MDNVETVSTILQSVWNVLLLNASLMGTLIFSLLWFVLGFGFDLLNFFIELIVFLSVVYYLLSNSHSKWLPLEWINKITSLIPSDNDDNYQLKIAQTIEDSISGVFVLSAKMSIFYGFYTYFIHLLFNLNIVFIPSMFAAIFAAIPLLPPWVVGIFGIIELYFVQGNTLLSVIFASANFAPLFFADPAFYKELKGSHPYLTGLSVIGGIYWLGLQGAILGPIILCLMITFLNLCGGFFRNTYSENSEQLQH